MEVDISKNIAIIGAGFFGCAIAHRLASKGHQCSVYERKGDILEGTASSNVYRIHRGPHYPRSLETASQCLEGYEKFCLNFPDSVCTDFPNYYLISSRESSTNISDFLKFCDKLDIPSQEISKSDIPEDFANCDGGVFCKEGTINVYKMRNQYHKIFDEENIELLLNNEITSLSKEGDKFLLRSAKANYQADIVINSSFNNMNLGFDSIHESSMELKYQRTVCFKCKTSQPLFGLTVMDGKFPTIFPTFWDKDSNDIDSFILYHVEHSVCREAHSIEYPIFDEITENELDDRFQKTLEKVETFIPKFREKILNTEYLVGNRIIRSNVEKSDMRLSEIINPIDNYFIIFQGKIDYSLNMAEEITSYIN